MRRRDFITLLGGAAAAWPLAARAQQRAMPLIAVLSPTTSQGGLPDNIAAFVRGLRALGYEDGKTVKLEFRFADWQFDRLPRLAAELVALNPNILFTHTTNGVNAARTATSDIPIVVGAAGDLLERGVIKSLARPGGNITGLTLLSVELDAKRIEFLKEVLPTIQRIAILVNPANPAWQRRPGDLMTKTKGLGVALHRVDARSPEDFDGAFTAIVSVRANAILVENDALFMDPGNRSVIASIARRYRLPTICENGAFAASGGLLSYGASIPAMFEYSATYVDKIIKGARPGELPVEQPTKFELVINLKTAKALGLDVPPTLLARADEVIE
jgi:putative tryptophan/tyrosine transport system substrate-binding protein